MGKSVARKLGVGALLLTCSGMSLVVGFPLGQILSKPALLALLVMAVAVAIGGRRMRE